VRFAFTAMENRAAAVPVVVRHAGGVAEVTVDETVPPSDGGAFRTLGAYEFGGAGEVEVSNKGTKGHVIIDAVQFVPAGK
jgi:hypothetical protein